MSHRKGCVVALVLALGCDRNPAPAPMGGTGGGGSTGGGATSETSDASTSSAEAGDSADTDASSTSEEMGCEALGSDRAACSDAEDCMWATMFRPDEASGCGVEASLSGSGTCIGRGEASTGRTTYYRELDGELRYLVDGQGCFTLAGAPVGWTECSGAAGEPEPCGCLCAGDECPWEAEALALEACGFEQPCGERVRHDLGDPLGKSMTCTKISRASPYRLS